jgi:hypothetical protein
MHHNAWFVCLDEVSLTLSGLTSNCYPPNLYFLSSWDYKREPPVPKLTSEEGKPESEFKGYTSIS